MTGGAVGDSGAARRRHQAFREQMEILKRQGRAFHTYEPQKSFADFDLKPSGGRLQAWSEGEEERVSLSFCSSGSRASKTSRGSHGSGTSRGSSRGASLPAGWLGSGQGATGPKDASPRRAVAHGGCSPCTSQGELRDGGEPRAKVHGDDSLHALSFTSDCVDSEAF